MTSKLLMTCVVLLLVAGTTYSDLRDDRHPTKKSCTSMLGAEVCAWATLDGERVVELLATIPMKVVEAAPPDAPMVWPPEQLGVIKLPAEARKQLGVDHLGINWEAHGHPPTTFLTPHFDFHFYSISRDAVQAIDCTNLSKPAALPTGYTLPDIEIPDMGTLVGLCVPKMGMHAMPGTDMETNDAFHASMMLGYYDSIPIFFEPMISRALLLERADFSLPMPGVEGLPEGVHYPSEFRADYDAEKDQYVFIASGF